MMTWNGYFFHSPSATLMESVSLMHDFVMMFLFSIILIVILNLTYVSFISFFGFEFFEHHQLENIWTMVPFGLLTFIVIPSLYSLYFLDTCLFCGMTVTIMAHQWYWSYYYKSMSTFNFDSYMLPSGENFIRLLDVDNRLSIPTGIPVRFLVSSSDVLHSWALPAFGVKMDAIPGRINQFCFSSNRSGIFFGQCSEICGANHSFMPIVMESLDFLDFSKHFLDQ